MSVVMCSLLIFIALCLLTIWYINIYNKFQSYIIRINECEANIDSTLRKRYDLLNKSINIIKANIKIEEDILPIINKLRTKKLSNFELDRQLYEAINEFNKYKETYNNLKKVDEFIKIDLSIHESEAEIMAFRKYYNDIITDYNKLVKIFPSNVIAKICKFKFRTYFDGKNMSDEDINDFKL